MIMRKKIQILLSTACIAALLGGCALTEEPAKDSSSNQNVKEDPRQGNLDALNPTAYSDVSGIALEPGSYISIIGMVSTYEPNGMKANPDLKCRGGLK